MAATVPELRNIIAQQDASGYDLTAITRAVRSTTWLDAVRLQCWLAGRGSMDVPAHNPMVTISAGTTSAFRYWTKPRYQTTRYAYTFVITGTAAACTVAIPSGGTAHSVPISSPRTMAPITLYADRSARSAAEAELSFDITAPAGSDVTVQCVSIEALPRATLDVDANDLGAERFDFWVRQPIASANIYDQILSRQNNQRDACRSDGMFQYSRGTAKPWSFNSGTFVDLFDDAIGILGRSLYSNDGGQRVIYAWTLAKCSDATTAGTLSINNTSHGAAAAQAIIPANTTSWTWVGGDELTVDSEDNTTADGLRGGAHDDHVFQCKRTAGTGTIQIATVSVFDGGA